MSDSTTTPFGRRRRPTATQSIPRGKSTGFARRNRAENDPNYVPPAENGDGDEVETKVIAPPKPKPKKPATSAETE